MSRPADAAQRTQVLDPERSFIVRAPAGSGKTELLMQRFLRLLATVAEPEEILAITFTRKAAAEMRQRILGAIWPAPGAGKLLPETEQLATAVREINAARGWQLEDYPARLRVRTIDSVNSWLTASAPATGEGTALGGVAENGEELYELAARRMLECITDDDEPGPSMRKLLAHLDNQTGRLIDLMGRMLSRRDQWLGLFGSGDVDAGLRESLETCLRELVERELQSFVTALPVTLLAELCEVTRTAAANIAADNPDAALVGWLSTSAIPDADADNLPLWQSFAKQWLTAKGDWRKTVNKNSGFPPRSVGKDRAIELLGQVALHTEAHERLATVSGLPPPRYSDAQWEALAALIRVLPQTAAHLLLVFRERGETDYPQIAREALAALRGDEGPSALALRLDYRIRHILIDEFQDTSVSQYDLLLALTEGWVDDGTRTVFLVGDPMQSIYRFRQAEVGLFLRLWKDARIEQVRLQPIELAANFRSDETIVDWVNTTFGSLLPPESDPVSGRVRFSASVAALQPSDECGVEIHPLLLPARVDEARQVADIVAATLASGADADVGILVRTRNQARLIIPELRRRNIAFRGTGLDQPGESGLEQELIALARALAHPGDRVAWLAVLRAPWCGLTLADTEALCGGNISATVWQLMQEADLAERLSADGLQRLERCRELLADILGRRGRLPFRDWVEGAWQQLGGPAALADDYDLERIGHVFAALDRLEVGGDIAEAFRLNELLGDRPDAAVESDARVEIMTMHKAKGLQFHTVILPGLDSGTRANDKELLAWHEVQRPDAAPAHLLAPLEAQGDDSDPLQALVRRFQRDLEHAEQDRLLYVATTRAEKRLHVFFALEEAKDGGFNKPRTGSLLARLWPAIEHDFASFAGQPGTRETREEWVQPPIRRYPLSWQGHPPPAAVDALPPPGRRHDERELTFDWAGATAAKVGTVVHRFLQQFSEIGADNADMAAVAPLARVMLAEAGVPGSQLDAEVGKVVEALHTTLNDDKGRWVLSGEHAEAASELPLTAVTEEGVRHFIVDRTFVADDGVRWIVDYKTSPHEGADTDYFVAEQMRRYAGQLEDYRKAMQLLESERDRTIRTALYFPLQGRFSPYED